MSRIGTIRDILAEAFSNVSPQFPMPTDGDTVYVKDVDLDNTTTNGTFTGDIEDLFSTYTDTTILIDSSATSPKTFTIKLKRPIRANFIAIGSGSGDFSNVKIYLKDLVGTTNRIIDDSSNTTKYTSRSYPFEATTFITIVVEFYTTDTVDLNGMLIPKIRYNSISSIDGYVSETNSTDVPLGISGVFTGSAVDTLNYGMVVVSLKSDQASVADGLQIQFSPDGTNWDHEDVFTIAAATSKTFTLQTVARYLRIIYTNGTTAQTYFRMQTTLKPVYVKPSSHRIVDAISGQDDAELIKAVITGRNPGGTFINFEATNGGNFKVSVEELESAISVNGNSQLRITLFDSSGNELTLDPVHNSALVGDIQHHEIHEGNFYHVSNYNTSVATSGTIVYSILTGTNYVHLKYYGACGGDADVQLREGATVTGGTSETIYNKNRNSSNTPLAAVTLNPTVTVAGTLLGNDFIPGGGGPTGNGGQQSERDEWVLIPNTRYNVILTNNSSTAQPGNLLLEWYEVS